MVAMSLGSGGKDLEVQLLDGASVKANVTNFTKAGEVCQTICHELGLEHGYAYCLWDRSAHNWLPIDDSTVLQDYFKEKNWSQAAYEKGPCIDKHFYWSE